MDVEPAKRSRLFRSKACTERRHSILYADLMQCDDIHIPFNDDALATFANRSLRQVEPVEEFRLLEHICFGSVEVFRHAIIQNAPRKTDDAAEIILDRKDYTISEAIETPSRFAF